MPNQLTPSSPSSWPADTTDHPTTPSAAPTIAAAALAAYHTAQYGLYTALARASRARTARALARADLASVRTQHARHRHTAGLAPPPGLGQRTARAEAEAAALGEALPDLVRDHVVAVEAAEEEERAAILGVRGAEMGLAQAEWEMRWVLGVLMGCGWGVWEVQGWLCLSPSPSPGPGTGVEGFDFGVGNGEGQAQQQQQQQQQQQPWEDAVSGEQQAAGEGVCPAFQRWRQGRLSGDGQQHQAREALRQCFAQQVQQVVGGENGKARQTAEEEKEKARQAAEEKKAGARRAAEEERARARQAAKEERAEIQELRKAGLVRFADGSIGHWWQVEDGDEDWTDDEFYLGPSFRPRRAKR